ncbi:MAG TPA: dihydrofolate reductase [Candidatus Saccharibacteria bacterium]|nr:dihydrofolate reductase [Candidatus Saccharibacteria bacterium]
MIALIVARAASGVIGSRNDLPWYLPADLRRFKELTTGHTVVMGRKTYESIVRRLGHPLPDRRNVVLTRTEAVYYEGVETIHSVERIKELSEPIFVIGGAEVYQQTITMADRLYITEIKAEITGDTYFPVLKPSEWREVSREPHPQDERNQYEFDFVEYERV